MADKCARCEKPLKNPHSVARMLGPICYRKSGGGVFDGDLKADEKEWERRRELLLKGGEVDFGVHWKYFDETTKEIEYIRISLRFNKKEKVFEAYGAYDDKEVIFGRTDDVKEAYRLAVAAGPTCNAIAEYKVKQINKELKRIRQKAKVNYPRLK